ncbi:MAG: asparagine--tRNA ligase [Candidatus Hydrothermales bacterium]
MEFIDIVEAGKYLGKKVRIKGWLYNKRSKGKIHFLIIRDGTGFIQGIVVKDEVDDRVFKIYDDLSQESSIIVSGIIREDKRSPYLYEISIRDIELVQKSFEYPIQKKEHGVGFLLPYRHLWLRSRKQWAIMRIRHEIIRAIRDFLDNEGFILIDAPILTPSACEGTTTLFETDYFGEKAYLSQSGQLYMEAACMAHKKVYCFGPTFRAEKSKTKRHLMEFWMVEPEIAFAELDDIIELSERFVSYIVERVLDKNKEELKILERNTLILEKISPPFPKITYTEAVTKLREKFPEFEWGQDFGAPHEHFISTLYEKPLVITRYPKKVKAFYMKPDPQNSETVLCMDVLAPEGYGEIIGGSQREDDYDALLKRMEEEKMPIEYYNWYLDLRRYGSVPHSGFGLGLERTVCWICGLEHIRESIPFPRLLERIYP